jgi:hypothetical protein
MNPIPRLIAAFILACAVNKTSAAPLLFLNYNPVQTAIAQNRAAALGLSYVTLADFNGMADLSGRSVIIMPGPNSYTYQADLLRDYIQGGGYAWINVAGPNCSTDFAPGGVDYLHYSCGGSVNQSESIVNPTQSFIQGNFDPQAKALDASDFLNWNATDLGHLSQLPVGTSIFTQNAQGPTLAQYSFGAGSVVVSTLTFGWGENGAHGDALDNMLLFAAGQVRDTSTSLENVSTPEPSSIMFTVSGLLFGVTLLRRKR